MRRTATLVLLVGFLTLRAQGQEIHGSIVVAYAAEGEAAVAADSRGSFAKGYIDDGVCKISTFGNQLIVSLAGIKGHMGEHGKFDWDVLAMARNVFRSLQVKPAPYDLPSKFATAWGEALKNQFTKELRIRSKETLANRAGYTDDGLASGLVIGRGREGAIEIYVIKLTYSRSQSGLFSADYKATSFTPPGTITIGESAIANEILYRNTQRGTQWASEVAMENMNATDRLRNVIPIIRMVELSVKYLPFMGIDGVGGPVDAVKMTADGKINWIQRKPNCPAD